MRKILFIALILGFMNVMADGSKPCTITSYQDTPPCYAKQDPSGGIVISQTVATKDKDVCVVKPGCNRKVTYHLNGSGQGNTVDTTAASAPTPSTATPNHN